jgi:HupE / UreJ protein
MQHGQRPAWRMLAAAVLVLAIQAAPRAHDIPDEIVLQTYVKPEPGQLKVLLRVPLIAVTDANLPKDGTGFLALPYIDPALREAANQISNGIVLLENEDRLTGYEMMNARISLPSDKSFNTYDGALARVRGPKIPDATQVYYNQGFLDLELNFPIRSQESDFALRVLFGRGLANRTATYINFIRPDGGIREFRLHDDTSLVRLDPHTHQAAWGFLTAGFYRFLDGLDPLLFVLVLAIPYRQARDLVRPILAFALAHSITLALSASGMAPAGSWFPAAVGVLIALSIVYVAIENAIGASLRRRWIVAFVFGLAHGFGFAIQFRDVLQFAGAHQVAALISFNVGLELGTIVILSIAMPALTLLFTHVVTERAGTIVLSAIIAHTGWHWMMDRLALLRVADWPLLDVTVMLGIVRWLLAITVIGGALWFVAGLLKKKPREPELAEKSIVDSR